MKVPFVDLRSQDAPLRGALASAMERVTNEGSFILGDDVGTFEEAFASFVGTRHAIGVANGLAALELILRGYDIGPGDEVVVPAHTFVGSAACASLVGATAVFADVDESFTVDPVSVEAAITSRTRAIVAVHLYGRPADMAALSEIAKRHGLKLIEDAAQAHGARFRGRRVGALGDAAAFSFYPSKNLGASGDAGAVTTDDEELAERITALRNCGQRVKGVHSLLPCNQRLDTLQAAVLNVRLPHLERWNEARSRAAAWYREALADASVVLPPDDDADRSSVWHLYVVRSQDRDGLARSLNGAGVATGIHYPLPVHLQPYYRALGHGEGTFPVAERMSATILSLPMHPGLTREDVDLVAEGIRRHEAIPGSRLGVPLGGAAQV